MLFDSIPNVKDVIDVVDEFFKENYRDFSDEAKKSHPIMPPKSSKIIRDAVWGTNRFDWYEMAVIDSPILQRLRYLHQVGFGTYVYPSATHSRFNHSLGTSIIAGKVFDNLLSRKRETLEQIATSINKSDNSEKTLKKMRQEVRLAALLHDSGHTMFSHSSEPVHLEIDLLANAREELSLLAGKPRSTGEVLSFCISQSVFLRKLLERYKRNIPKKTSNLFPELLADLDNVSLMIIGRTKHPYSQFLGDIISSGFDADKLDYLMRDGRATGLPVSYDLDRYLQFVSVDLTESHLDDPQSLRWVELLYGEEKEKGQVLKEYRLKIPQDAITSMEEIIIGKFMLFGYMYHHSKVRGIDSYLERVLKEEVIKLKERRISDKDLIKWMLSTNDAVIVALPYLRNILVKDNFYSQNLIDCAYRISTRTLPREILGINGSAVSNATATNIINFITKLQDKDRRDSILADIEDQLRAALPVQNATFWVDAPPAPNFEDVKNIIGGRTPFNNLFPVDKWMEAYMAYTYKVRVFTFSEYVDAVVKAVSTVMPRILGVESEVINSFLRNREK